MKTKKKDKEKDKEKGRESLEQKLAQERTSLSYERTNLSVLRTNLSFQNSKLSVEQTHLSFLRTVVSLVGSAATIYKGLPAIGVSATFSTLLSLFLLAAAVYFFVKDRLTYPKLKKEIERMEEEKEEMIRSSMLSEHAAMVDAAACGEQRKEEGQEEG
ncbi:MAG: hypothetical protein K6E18_07960 [Lachnospiraceae bacterium]|nr:hypothetical protein [Lachnospiraceae bacterium]